MLGQPIEEIEARKQTPLLALDFTFRPQASLIVPWTLGDDRTRRIIERAHERAIAKALRWLEDEVARPGDDGEPVWGALDTFRLYQHVVAAGTLYTLTMTTEVCEERGLATVPREVTPGLRPVMEIAGVDSELIDWSSTRRQRIEDALEGLTYKFAPEHGRLPCERARNGLGWQAVQDTRPEKKTPRPLKQLLAWWRASALLKFGKQMVDGLLRRCRAAGAATRARVEPRVDAVLAAVDVAPRSSPPFAASAPAATSWPKPAGTCWRRCAARSSRAAWTTTSPTAPCPTTFRQSTVPKPGRRTPDADQLFYTADFAEPDRW